MHLQTKVARLIAPRWINQIVGGLFKVFQAIQSGADVVAQLRDGNTATHISHKKWQINRKHVTHVNKNEGKTKE